MESTLTHLECGICGESHDAEQFQTICTACGRPLLARYDLDAARRTFDAAALGRRVSSLWRYAELLPVRDAGAVVSLGEGMTPLLAAPRLGEEAGVPDLWIKDEGQNPTGTFKARGMTAAVSRALELGATELATPTAGNAGSALAAYAASAGVPAHVAMPKDAPPAVIDEVRQYGATLELVDGFIGDAGAYIARGAAEHGWFELSTLKEPYRVEGKKTMGLRDRGAAGLRGPGCRDLPDGRRDGNNRNMEGARRDATTRLDRAGTPADDLRPGRRLCATG